MTGGVDPAFERTVQVQPVVASSELLTAAEDTSVLLGQVPAGYAWLIERMVVSYRPGEAPTVYVGLTVSANAPGAGDRRDAVELKPAAGWVAGERYVFGNDNASPVRFFALERVFVNVPTFGSSAHKARVTVTAQVRLVQEVPDAHTSGSVTPLEPVTPGEQDPPDPNAWG